MAEPNQVRLAEVPLVVEGSLRPRIPPGSATSEGDVVDKVNFVLHRIAELAVRF